MKKVLLTYAKRQHESALKEINQEFQKLKSFVETVKTETNKIDITKENLEKLIKDPKGYIFDLIVDKENLNFNGLPISRKKAIEMIDFDTDFQCIINEAKNIEKFHLSFDVWIDDYKYKKLSFDDIILEDGDIKISEQYLSEVKDSFSVYTVNELQNSYLASLESIKTSIDKLLNDKFLSKLSLENHGLEALGFKFFAGDLIIDKDKVKRIR